MQKEKRSKGETLAKKKKAMQQGVARPEAQGLNKGNMQKTLQMDHGTFHKIIESLQDGIVVLDREFRCTYMNRAMEGIANMSLIEVIDSQMRISELFPHLIEQGIDEMMRKAMDGKVTQREGIPYHLSDGKQGLTKETYLPLKGSDGEITGIVGIISDITKSTMAEERLRLLISMVEQSSESIMCTDREFRITFINKATEELYGYGFEELQGKTPDLFNVDPHADQIQAEIYSTVASGKSYIGEALNKKRDGDCFYCQFKVSPLLDEHNQICGYMGFQRDVTEQKLAEERLCESAEKYRLLIENQTDLVVKIDTKGRFLFVSPSYCELFGKTEKEVLRRQSMPLVHEDDRESTAKAMEDLYHPPYTSYVEQRAMTRQGWRWLAWGYKSVLDSDNKVIAIVGAGRDITERKEAESALLEAKGKYQALLEHASDAIILIDIEGNLIEVNKKAEELSGFTRDEMARMNIAYFLKGEMLERAFLGLRNCLEKGTASLLDLFVRRRDGMEIPTDITANVVQFEGKCLIQAIIRDISEKRRIEFELQKLQKLESIGILAGGIAHDFNNILTPILGNISLAKVYMQPEDKTYKALSDAERAVMQAKRLTQQLLTFSKGGVPIKRPASIGQLIRESVEFTLKGSNVRCQFELPEDLWLVEFDEGHMNQVLNNLIINADQAMPEGGVIKVRAENVLLDNKSLLPLKEGKYIKITMQDKGIGIPKEYLKKVFDPYFTTKQKGSGLGLAIVYSIIKKHGGHILVESKEGRGTTFQIFLPVSDKCIAKGTDRKGVAQGMEKGPLIIQGKGRVLVLDDDESVRSVLGLMLAGLGYDTMFTKDGAETVELYREALKAGNPFDAVIMDLTIPGAMGGAEALVRMRHIDPEVRAIASSGYSNDQIMSCHQEYGFKGVIVKPYGMEELSEVLHKVITEKRESKAKK